MNGAFDRADIVGIILAGGRSRRMGGGEKALMPLAGKAMVAHVIGRFAPQVAATVLIVNGDPAPFRGFGLPIAADAYGDYAGPLAGLLSGMIWAREHCPGARWVATAPCDTPFLPENYVAALREAAGDCADAIVIAASGGRSHFASGLWPIALREDLAEWLGAGGRRMQSWIERHPHFEANFAPVITGTSSVDPFFNVNTPEDYAAAGAVMKEIAVMTPPIFGVVGWKNSGKTTLMSRLIAEFAARGIKVAAVKHAHHAFDIDQPGRDSYKFREAGAREVAVVSANRVAIMQELRGEDEPGLDEIVARLKGSNLILVEGFKTHDHAKIEARRKEAVQGDPLAGAVPGIVAVASDHATETEGLPVFRLDDASAIADFITRYTGLDQSH
jgi:molybdenum cofactor guanylyltransferase/molybdopterin-guanine dinucleotide biosynthesis protein MobB